MKNVIEFVKALVPGIGRVYLNSQNMSSGAGISLDSGKCASVIAVNGTASVKMDRFSIVGFRSFAIGNSQKNLVFQCPRRHHHRPYLGDQIRGCSNNIGPTEGKGSGAFRKTPVITNHNTQITIVLWYLYNLEAGITGGKD